MNEGALIRQLQGTLDTWHPRGEGSPEGNLARPLGAEYQDTLNGLLYVKEGGGSGPTGWQVK